MINKKFSISDVHSYLAGTIDENPPDSENIRIAIWQKDRFIQYLDVPREFSDNEILELCQGIFDAPIRWEHFSCPERYTGPVNEMPPATGDAVMTMYF